jgi:alanine racemase
VARFQARVVSVRRLRPGDTVSYGATWLADHDTTIATLAAGYADGIHRSLSNRGKVELRGAVCPIVGRVTMDLTMVSVGDGDVAVGDTATLFGGMVSLDEQADLAGTISYELLTALGPRLPRLYRRTT